MSLKKYKEVIHKDFLKDIDFIDKTIKKLNLPSDSRIIDIGTGIGAMAILLALNNLNVLTGEPKLTPETECSNDHNHYHNIGNNNMTFHKGHYEDPAKEDWEHWGDWKVSAKKLGVLEKIKYQHFNAEKLPFANESFNGIFMYDTLQHIHNRDIAIKECLRVLTPDGAICVIEWSKETIEHENEAYGYEIEYVDPRNYIKTSNISIETIPGKFVIIYVIQKN